MSLWCDVCVHFAFLHIHSIFPMDLFFSWTIFSCMLCVRRAHVVTELYNLSKEINLSFYFFCVLFSISFLLVGFGTVFHACVVCMFVCLFLLFIIFLCLVITISRFLFFICVVFIVVKVFCSSSGSVCVFVSFYVRLKNSPPMHN